MKKMLFFSTVLLLCVMSACSLQSRDNLPVSVVKDAVDEQMKLNMLDQSYTKLKTGYFECKNSFQRITLAKLAAAGVIEYKVQRYAWWNKHLYAGNSFGTYYGGESYSYEEHFMVSVKLIKEGESLRVDSVPAPPKLVDEQMKQPDVDSTKLPELHYAVEKWPEIPCPAKKNVKLQKEEPQSEIDTMPEEEKRGNINDIFADIDIKQEMPTQNLACVAMDVLEKTKYEAEKKKENTKDVILRSSSLKVDGVRFIQTYTDQSSGLDCAEAEVIVKAVDVTAAGRILDMKTEGSKLCATIKFVYYDDLGWILLDKDFNFSGVSEKWGVINGSNPQVEREETSALNHLNKKSYKDDLDYIYTKSKEVMEESTRYGLWGRDESRYDYENDYMDYDSAASAY